MPDAELVEVRDFLAGHEPFASLPGEELPGLARRFAVRYVRRGTKVMAVGAENHHLYLIRSGAVEILNTEGHLVERSGEGTCFGTTTLTGGNPSRFDVTTIEDSLVLLLPGREFHRLAAEHAAFADWFGEQRAARMRGAVADLHRSRDGEQVLRTALRSMLGRDLVTTQAGESIRQAAATMSAESVSCLLVTEGGRIAGILTDRDLRNRVLAEGRDPQAPVSEVMTRNPVVARPDASALEALMEMVSRNIHHLPVVDDDGRPVGVVTSTDLIRLEKSNPVHLVGEVARKKDLPGVARAALRQPQVVEKLVAQDVSADDISRVVTGIGDAVERRLVSLIEAELGPAPVPYCWVVLGSQARSEQGLAGDQDNALILSDDVRPEHGEYFERLAFRVTQALVECGYPLCPGEVMARNPEWRQPVSAWKRQFSQWIHEPTPDAVLRSAIFFDMRAVYGDPQLCEQLREQVLQWTTQSTRFQAHLAKNAVAHEPPLGFFRHFVLERHGEHRNAFDLKLKGIAPVVQLARVHALARGLPVTSTRARLAAAANSGAMEQQAADDLSDAFEFLRYLRFNHQAEQVRSRLEPDNFINPLALSTMERRHLKDAFEIIKSAQSVIAQRFTVGYL